LQFLIRGIRDDLSNQQSLSYDGGLLTLIVFFRQTN